MLKYLNYIFKHLELLGAHILPAITSVCTYTNTAYIHSSLNKYTVFLCFIDVGGVKRHARVNFRI